MGKRTAGVCYLKVDGELIEIAGDVECPLTEFKREPVMGADGVVGYKETPVAPYIKVTGITTPGFPIEKLRQMTDGQGTAEFANGRVYSLSGMWLQGDTGVKSEAGTADLEFYGLKGRWL
ncbi:phage tail tube protein [Derxia gummosa]|uniref:Phage tail tube protein n=1 Tax=Derxia gummosa DSM 723 TaxID=1121388 RepID=A0A8B6X2S9_9BURK|nr:phage tail tube protein [Derxia gummosa]